MTTREKILEAALSLFAEKGYNGTSVGQIAKSVGIKAPSLYKHFKGKEDILNTLIDMAESRYELNFGSEKNIGQIPGSAEEFVLVTMEKIRFTMCDPMIRKVRMFLVQEQFRSEKFAEVTTRHQVDGIQTMYRKIIEGMMETGLARQDDPAMLSVELTAPAAIYISKADRQPQLQEEMLVGIEQHIRHFCRVYMTAE
ncbi:MAG: TetR/AcrR family transcriptional regulator [Lachnospiraceae bacterium]|nr:TetR/AcrR family transcriptional regulator [Lachnospiraceae bacterium]